MPRDTSLGGWERLTRLRTRKGLPTRERGRELRGILRIVYPFGGGIGALLCPKSTLTVSRSRPSTSKYSSRLMLNIPATTLLGTDSTLVLSARTLAL